MSATEINSWQDVRDVVLARIQSRVWKSGELIPNEVDLAEEFGCARATVNRALRAVADQGLIDRRRKAGTRVATHPIRRATLKIPVIRQEIEGLDQRYSYQLVLREFETPNEEIRNRMALEHLDFLLHLKAVHFADDLPYAFEDRWINPDGVVGVDDVDFESNSANEWLVQNAHFTRGEIKLFATEAATTEAALLETQVGKPLFGIERTTWNDAISITHVKLLFAPGYQMCTEI